MKSVTVAPALHFRIGLLRKTDESFVCLWCFQAKLRLHYRQEAGLLPGHTRRKEFSIPPLDVPTELSRVLWSVIGR